MVDDINFGGNVKGPDRNSRINRPNVQPQNTTGAVWNGVKYYSTNTTGVQNQCEYNISDMQSRLAPEVYAALESMIPMFESVPDMPLRNSDQAQLVITDADYIPDTPYSDLEEV